MRLKYWIMLLLGAFVAGACSSGEIEDMYPVSPDNGGGNGGNKKGYVEDLIESMVRIPGGTFLMGKEDAETDEAPAHLVTLDAFYISQFTVTQQLYEEIMGVNPSTVKKDHNYGYGYTPSYYEDYPVTNVSYDDCLEFIRKLNEKTGKNFDLPTEAQWELAARGEYQKYNYSSDYSSPSFYYKDNGYMTLHEVGNGYNSGYSNDFGLYHMSGNVHEWVKDWFGVYSPEAQINPQGPAQGTYRIFRGGSVASSKEKCRVTTRASNYPFATADDLGFRLVLNGCMDLQVAPSTLSFSRSGGQEIITVTTENNWSYESSASWCRVSKSGNELTVNVEANDGKIRSARIMITAGEDEFVVPVDQDGETFELVMDGEAVDTLLATYLGGEANLSVRTSSPIDWMITSADPSWCHVEKKGTSIHVAVDECWMRYYGRETYILLSSIGNTRMTDTVWIRQDNVVVGDYYEKDGVRGIVYKIDSYWGKVMIVSLTETTACWSNRSFDGETRATSSKNGKSNMSNVQEQGDLSNWPAFEWCYNYSDDHEWYLPATDELVDLFDAIREFGASKFDQLLTQYGGDEISSASDYWSSTEYWPTSSYAYTVVKSGKKDRLWKINNRRVRAIREVTLD